MGFNQKLIHFPDSRIMKKDGKLFYWAKPDRKNDELSAKVFLEWEGGWYARVEARYSDIRGKGYSDQGFFKLNFSAAEKICEFYNYTICKEDRKDKNSRRKFVEIISMKSPGELEKISKYEINIPEVFKNC